MPSRGRFTAGSLRLCLERAKAAENVSGIPNEGSAWVRLQNIRRDFRFSFDSPEL
jgi:hypothetical protein